MFIVGMLALESGVYMCMRVCVTLCIYVRVCDDDDSQMGGRCIIGNCPVARITAILATISPFSVVLGGESSDIYLLACMQISSNKNGTHETHLGLPITRPCV